MGLISPTFYTQLLCAQIPKAQKDSQVITVFLRLGSAQAKAAHKTLAKMTPDLLEKKLLGVQSLYYRQGFVRVKKNFIH